MLVTDLDGKLSVLLGTLDLEKCWPSYFLSLQEILEDHNIRPGDSYSVDKIQEALKEGLGGQAFLNCERNNVLIEVCLQVSRCGMGILSTVSY